MIEIPENSLYVWQWENMEIAKFFGVSPNEVEYEWTYLDFLDRLEFMKLQNYLEPLTDNPQQ